ncbi:TetR/AcrR family transcriptional regulator [Parasulfitobacter algicola]|uniref:TetR/AcrR family transcriptional regulator n=1 Tax=Parasulfitobacter algicola TaxID=2614809 RepID=A0ABX2ITD7_9RHOB|nr:TetR-like C-terminal domain-containing protein [Sulfitobacter algicola]NSX56174.1 TetR/AcrR family transcriptional regulator [Sulfitobacter algicola]
MAGKVEKRREDLRVRLIEIAEKRISEGGITHVRARDLATEAECAVGAIYNVFGDLNDIIIAVNGRTFSRIGKTVAASIKDQDDLSPTDVLIKMSHAYLHFASEHKNEWRTLFDLQMSIDRDVPDWYMAELQRLFQFIYKPLQQVFPDMSETDLALMTRSLFSSVHGIVLLGLERRISAVPTEELERMIEMVLRKVTEK